MTEIKEFAGKHRFLSNFGDSITLTSEHLFQAMKGTSWEDVLFVLAAPTAGAAKRRGNLIKKRDDWEKIRDEVMWCVIQIKFAAGTELAQRLLDTGDAELIEGNWWGDDYWGFDLKTQSGANKLGKTLMEWREMLREDNDD